MEANPVEADKNIEQIAIASNYERQLSKTAQRLHQEEAVLPRLTDQTNSDDKDSRYYDVEREKLSQELRRKELENVRYEQESQREGEKQHLRGEYLSKSFLLVEKAIMYSILIVVMAGYGALQISDSVLITILGTTMANVIGILLVAFNWLYPHRDRKEDGENG